MNASQKAELRRAIRLPQAAAMVAGTIIGASIFVQPSEITGHVPSIAGVFLVWLVSGILTFFGALVAAELASTFTRSGGVYVFLKEAFSPALGFLWGWAMFWVMHSGIIAAISVVFGRYLAHFVPLGEAGIKAAAVGAILLLTAVNMAGIKQGSGVQTLFTLGKVVAIVLVVAAGLALGGRVPEHFVGAGAGAAGVSARDFLLAVAAGLFAFGGWHMVTYSAEETVRPEKTIPRALLLGTAAVTVCYIALNAVYLYVLPLETVAASTRVAADAADALLGSGGGAIMSGLVVFSTLGALSGIVYCGPRVYYAMARDGLLFRWLGEVHDRRRTPDRALMLQAVWSSALVVTGTYRTLFTRVVYTEWIFFGLMAVGLFVLRGRAGLVRGFKVWGYPVLPAVFVVSSFAIVANQVVSSPAESAAGLALVAAGLPVYVLWVKRRNEPPQGELP